MACHTPLLVQRPGRSTQLIALRPLRFLCLVELDSPSRTLDKLGIVTAQLLHMKSAGCCKAPCLDRHDASLLFSRCKVAAA